MNPGDTLLEPELQAYLQQLTAIEQDTRLLLDGLTEVQLGWRDTGRMSVADCLITCSSLRALDGGIRRHWLRPDRGFWEGPFRHGTGKLVRCSGCPPPIKFKAPKRIDGTDLSVSASYRLLGCSRFPRPARADG